MNEFQRFMLVQSGTYWNETAFSTVENYIWSGNKRIFHEIALASFAKIVNTENTYYFDCIWGGRFGKAWQIDLSKNFEKSVWKEIWVS